MEHGAESEVPGICVYDMETALQYIIYIRTPRGLAFQNSIVWGVRGDLIEFFGFLLILEGFPLDFIDFGRIFEIWEDFQPAGKPGAY